jgi:hypothetical protein
MRGDRENFPIGTFPASLYSSSRDLTRKNVKNFSAGGSRFARWIVRFCLKQREIWVRARRGAAELHRLPRKDIKSFSPLGVPGEGVADRSMAGEAWKNGDRGRAMNAFRARARLGTPVMSGHNRPFERRTKWDPPPRLLGFSRGLHHFEHVECVLRRDQ